MQIFLPYIIISLKAILIYVFIIIAIRVFGKKELAQLSVIDLVFILLISNSVQNAMVGSNNTLLGGISAALGLFICNYFFKVIINKFPRFNKIIQGEKIILVHDGEILKHSMRKAMMSDEELFAAIREHGVEHISQVNLAILEVDGNISVISDGFQTKSTKKRKSNKKWL